MPDIELPAELVEEITLESIAFRDAKLKEAAKFYSDLSTVSWPVGEPEPPTFGGKVGGSMKGASAGEMPPLTLDDTRKRYWGPHAWGYDHDDRENSEKWNAENAAVKLALTIATEVKDRPPVEAWVLDIPCGTGRFFALYRELGLDFIGMDVSEDMMSIAKQKDIMAEVHFGDIEKIPLADKSVDTTVCTRLLNLMLEEEMVKAVQEIGRVSRSHIICSLFTGDRQIRNKRAWVHRESVFLDALAKAGFKPKKTYPLPRPYYNIWHCEVV